MKRTLSIGSRVPPAVTSTRTEPQLDGASSDSQAVEQLPGLGEPADPLLAVGGQLALARSDHGHAPCRQQLEVGLRRRVQVHAVVHRGRNRDRAACCERSGRHEVVGEAVPKLGERVRASRREQVDLRSLDERQVADRSALGQPLAGPRAAGRIRLELAGEHRRAGDRLKRRGADEPPAGLSLDHANRVTGLDREPRRLERFVGRDPAADTEEQPGH